MADAKAFHAPLVDPDSLTSDQVQQLQFVLDRLTLHQLIQLASMVAQVSKLPGFGQICIKIERGHPIEIEAGLRSKFLPSIDDRRLHELME